MADTRPHRRGVHLAAIPTWAVFAGTLAAILTLGLAPESQALSGFSNAGVLSVIVPHVVAEAMCRTRES